MTTIGKYAELQKRKLSGGWQKARQMSVCYLFLLPFATLFLTFYILPMVTSIRYSFTYY